MGYLFYLVPAEGSLGGGGGGAVSRPSSGVCVCACVSAPGHRQDFSGLYFEYCGKKNCCFHGVCVVNVPVNKSTRGFLWLTGEMKSFAWFSQSAVFVLPASDIRHFVYLVSGPLS